MFLNLIRVSLVTGILILLLLLFFRLVRGRYTAALKYWIWLLLTLRLLVPVTVTLPQRVSTLPAVRTVAETQYEFRQSVNAIVSEPEPVQSALPESAQTVFVPGAAADAEINTATDTPSAARETAALDWKKLVGVIWGFGALAFLGYHGLVSYAFRRYVRRWGFPTQDKQLKELVLRAKRNCGLQRPLKLLILESVGSPMVLGVRRPVLLLPQESWDATELYYVLRHELTHIKRRDMLYKGLLLVCNAIHWFNPAVWLMRYRAYQDLEICCDMAVVDGATRDVRMRYCETIMATAQRSAGVGMAATFGSTKKSILERFREIFSEKSKKRGTAILLLVLTTAVLAGCSLSLGAALAGDDAEPPEQLSYTSEEAPDASVETEQGTPPQENSAQDTITLSNGAVVPGWARDILFDGTEETLVSCERDGESLFSIRKLDVDGCYAQYGWLKNAYYDNWPTEALVGWDYMLGYGEQWESIYILRVTGSEPLEDSQRLVDELCLRNGITINPCLIAPPYYEAEDVDGAIAAMKEISDPETVKAEVLEKIKNGTNSAGADDDVLEAFAEFLGQRWEDYMSINSDDYVWSVEYDEDDHLTLKVIREEPVANETWYRTFLYENGTVVYGKHMGWLESYEAPDETTLLEETQTALSGAKNAGKVSEKAMDALKTWMKNAVIFVEQYGTWDWCFETVNDEKTVLTCTGTANGSGITPYVTLTYNGKTGEVSGESGNKGAASGSTGCVRYVPESRPEDMDEYMFHEGDMLDYFRKDAMEVLAEKGTPEVFLKDDDTVDLHYSNATYAFRFCSACQSYHLYEVQFSQGAAFHDISIGDSVEQVLSYFRASGAEPGYGSYLYRYDGDNYAQYVPVADTGLTMVDVRSGEMSMHISINRQNTVYNVEYIVYK